MLLIEVESVLACWSSVVKDFDPQVLLLYHSPEEQQ